MGKEWDNEIAFGTEIWIEALRVLKPGGFLLAFGGTRTYHRLVCGIEDAGFEIRDTIMWLYGSGFPKSLNIGKQIDKIQGNERERLGIKQKLVPVAKTDNYSNDRTNGVGLGFKNEFEDTKGSSEWEGWGTALKPACEPIVVARKPLSEKNVALNVLKWGTGGINIDDCRIGTEIWKHKAGNISPYGNENVWDTKGNTPDIDREGIGRFPANIILDEEAGQMLDEQSGELISGYTASHHKQSGRNKDGIIINDNKFKTLPSRKQALDKGGASRFFYCAKASKSERNFGCEGMEEKPIDIQQPHNSKDLEERYKMTSKNNHPTVKPIKLMEYLIKLVSREGATILDPFLGSGTTLLACHKLNRNGIGIEKEEEYIKIAKARLNKLQEQRKLK